MNKLISTLTLLFLFSPTIFATDYYFCDCDAGADANCAAGSDANSGLTHALAKQNLSSSTAIFTSALAGDTINFCRGGSFTTSSQLGYVNNNATALNPIIVQDYTSTEFTVAVDDRPILTQTTDNKMFAMNNSQPQEGYTFKNIEVYCTACTTGGASVGFYLYNQIDSVIMDNVLVDGFRMGVQGASNDLDNCELTNSQINNNLLNGWLGGCHSGLIENNSFDGNGTASNRDHNIYWSRGDDAIIRNNISRNSSKGGGSVCAGTHIVVHTHVIPLDNLLIEGNDLYEPQGEASGGCYGIVVNPGYAAAEEFTNIVIRGNLIEGMGIISIGFDAVIGGVIENNIIIANQNGVRVQAISNPAGGGDGLDSNNDNLTIQNNTIYVTSTFNATNMRGISINNEGSNNSITNNAIYYTGTDADWNCFLLSSVSITDNVDLIEMDNNICHFPNANGQYVDGYSTLSSWQAASIFGDDSKQEDPDFTDVGSKDFTSLNASSAMVNAGNTTYYAPTDYDGVTRTGVPDMGAYEFGSSITTPAPRGRGRGR